MRQRRVRGTGNIETFNNGSGIRHRARLRVDGKLKLGPTRDNVADALDDILRLRYPQPPPPPEPLPREISDIRPPRPEWRGGKKNEYGNRT